MPKNIHNACGFEGIEIFSSDELNIILDMEDEIRRLGNFKLIYPLKNTASQYYAFFEI